jgi:uncharacterized membrane protein YsdA (DUF1294 family)
MTRRRSSKNRPWFNPVWVSLTIGIAIPAAFTWAYSSTLNFAPLWVWLVTLNLTLVGLMGKDKLAAQKGWRRTPEATLLILTLLGATPGLLVARYLFNHKTSKESFQYGMFAIFTLQFLAVWYFWPQLSPYL